MEILKTKIYILKEKHVSLAADRLENEKQATLAEAERKRTPIPKERGSIGVQANTNEIAHSQIN